MSKLVVHMSESELRDIVRSETDTYRKVMEVLEGLPPMRTKDAAIALATTTKTINVWRKEKKIKCVKGGKIPVTEILRIKMGVAA